MADLVTIATTAALTQFVGPMFKHLGEQALERAKQIASKAAAQLTAVGREPQPVEPKLLVPLVQAASLESDPTLADHWAALLANAADPVQRVVVQPGFAEVLRQLTPDEAQVLIFIYDWRASSDDASPSEHNSLTFSTIFSHFRWVNDRMELSIDNLLRLRLFKVKMGGLDSVSDTDLFRRIILTKFGTQFLAAVTPPTP